VTADLHALRAVLARRWAVIVPAVVLVPVLTMLLTVGQSKVYSARAQVLLTYTDVGASVNGVAPAYQSTAPDRNLATQAALARNPAVAGQALKLAHVNMSATDLLHNSSVTTSSSADLLTFAVQDSPGQRAMTLATDYAQAYTMYRGQIARQTISSSLSGINRRLQELSAAGQTGTATYRFLSHDQHELSAIQAAGTNDAVVVQRAQSASAAGPRPARSAALGLGLGIALAAALAFLMETLDKRASVEEIGRRLRLPNLAIIPDASRWRRVREPLSGKAGWRSRASSPMARNAPAADGELVNLSGMIRTRPRMRAAETPGRREPTAAELRAEALAAVRDPYGRTADAYRVLKSSLEFARLEHDFKSLLFTSACQPGRSETVANLGVTLVQSGRRVLVCDLHAGRASISELFGLEECPGVTDVALGKASLEDSIVSVPASSLFPSTPPGTENLPGGARLNGFSSARRGYLGVLPFGGPPPHSGFLGTRDVAELMEELAHAHADLVLIDAPPLLASGEAQTLSVLADAMVVVLVDPVRPAILTDVAATLSGLPARPLGYITVGVVREGSESGGDGGQEVRPSSSAEISQPPGVSSAANGHGAVPGGVASMRSSELEPAGADESGDGAKPRAGVAVVTCEAEPAAVSGAEVSAVMCEAERAVVAEPDDGALLGSEAPTALAEAPKADAEAPKADADAKPAVVSLSHVSTYAPSAPADLWRVVSGICAIGGQAAVDRFPRAARITSEMSLKAAHELRRSVQPRIEAWSALALRRSLQPRIEAWSALAATLR
jgi:Mrp family chromosome partitioning ATPase/capsular polysaccharide biosynthesis protein